MNYVNLIGKVNSTPTFIRFDDGKTKAIFTLKTTDIQLDKNGFPTKKDQSHKIAAWGRNAKIIEVFGIRGQKLAIEGKLMYRNCTKNGAHMRRIEVVVNDLIVM